MPRLLCLHGYGTSADIFRCQLGHLIRECPKLDLVFVNAPNSSKAAPGIEVFFDGPYFRFYDTVTNALGHKKYNDLRTSVDYCVDILEKQGPFDGVIGFSQGANMATMLAGICENERPGLLKFVICVCGVDSGWGEQLPTLLGFQNGRKLTTPSLHIHGQQDGYLKLSERLAGLYDTPRVHKHTGDHRPLPSDVTEAKAFTKIIRDFITNSGT